MTRHQTVKDDYCSPEVRDLGTLVSLTRDFDASFHGSVAKVVTLAVVSVPLVGGSSSQSDPGGSLNSNSTGTQIPSSINPSSGMSPPAGGVLGETQAGGGTDPTAGVGGVVRSTGVGDSGAGGGAASLPFTGYAVMLTAGVGAAMAGTGAAVRSKLRRRSL